MFKSIFLSAFLLSSFALAEGPCKKDAENFCKEAKGDRQKMFQCMKDNADKLSPECKAQKEKMHEAMADLKEACGNDVETLCSDVEPGQKRLLKCLKKNKEKVSDACKTQLLEMKKLKKHKK